MKLSKKKMSVAVALAVVTAVLAVGCGTKATPESLMSDMSKKVKDVKSMSAEMKMDLSMSAKGQEMALALDMNMESIVKSGESHMDGTVEMKFGSNGINTKMESYTVKEGSAYNTYTKMNDKWTKSSSDDAKEFDSDIFESLDEVSKNFKLSDKTVKVEGEECFELTGKLTGDMLSNMFDQSMMESFGVSDVIDEDEIEKMELPCTIGINQKTLLPVSITFDMTKTVNEMLKKNGNEGKAGKYEISLIYKSFDNVKKITLPEEAKSAA